jgi:hypothetical protein
MKHWGTVNLNLADDLTLPNFQASNQFLFQCPAAFDSLDSVISLGLINPYLRHVFYRIPSKSRYSFEALKNASRILLWDVNFMNVKRKSQHPDKKNLKKIMWQDGSIISDVLKGTSFELSFSWSSWFHRTVINIFNRRGNEGMVRYYLRYCWSPEISSLGGSEAFNSISWLSTLLTTDKNMGSNSNHYVGFEAIHWSCIRWYTDTQHKSNYYQRQYFSPPSQIVQYLQFSYYSLRHQYHPSICASRKSTASHFKVNTFTAVIRLLLCYAQNLS